MIISLFKSDPKPVFRHQCEISLLIHDRMLRSLARLYNKFSQ